MTWAGSGVEGSGRGGRRKVPPQRGRATESEGFSGPAFSHCRRGGQRASQTTIREIPARARMLVLVSDDSRIGKGFRNILPQRFPCGQALIRKIGTTIKNRKACREARKTPWAPEREPGKGKFRLSRQAAVRRTIGIQDREACLRARSFVAPTCSGSVPHVEGVSQTAGFRMKAGRASAFRGGGGAKKQDCGSVGSSPRHRPRKGRPFIFLTH